MNRLLKEFGAMMHRFFARSPLLARAYFRLLPGISRWLPRKQRQQLRNSIQSVRWPAINFRPRTVALGRSTKIRLRPHFSEFDFEAVLGSHFDYEREVFEFIEERIRHYDTILDIGANVGVFTTFVAMNARARAHHLKIYAFEPSPIAFNRLTENLALNDLSDVQTFNCAVTDQTGFVDFFEPEGHITNGSLCREFAARFSPQVHCQKTLVVDGRAIEHLLAGSNRLLIKMDVEGAEPRVLRGLEQIIREWSPDLLIEVLAPVVDELNRIKFLRDCGYRLFHLKTEGPLERKHFQSDESRDYFLSAAPTAQRAVISSKAAAA
jgi:FkbM family methyltransferase